MTIMTKRVALIASAIALFLSGWVSGSYYYKGVLIALDGAVLSNVETHNVYIEVASDAKKIDIDSLDMHLPKLILPNSPYIDFKSSKPEGTISHVNMQGNWDLIDDFAALFVGYPECSPIMDGVCAHGSPEHSETK